MILTTSLACSIPVLVGACTQPSEVDDVESAGSELSDTDRRVLRSLREIEDHRRVGDPLIGELLRPSTRAQVLAAALRTVGQLRDASYEDAALGHLTHRSVTVRRAAASAARWLDKAKSRQAVLAVVANEGDVEAKATMLSSLHRTGLPEDVAFLGALVSGSEPRDVEQASAFALGTILQNNSAGAADLSAPAAQALWRTARGSRDGLDAGTAAFALVKVIQQAGSPFASGALVDEIVRSLGAVATADARATLAGMVAGLGTAASRTAALAALADEDEVVRTLVLRRLPPADVSEPTLDAIGKALDDVDVHVAIQAARAYAQRKELAAGHASALEHTYATSPEVALKAEVLTALVAVAPGRARPLVDQAIGETNPWLKAAALVSLPAYAKAEDTRTFLAYLVDPDTAVVNGAFEGLRKQPEDLLSVSEVKESLRALALSERDDVLVQVTLTVSTFEWQDLAPSLSTTLGRLSSSYPLPIRNVLNTLGRLNAVSELAVIDTYLRHSDLMIATAAVRAHNAITGETLPLPTSSTITEETPSDAEIDEAIHSDLVLETTRGEVRVRLSSEAPITAAKFSRLVRQGAMNGDRIGRDEPGSTGLFGEPTFGYTSYSPVRRSELSSRQFHGRFSMAFANSGRDSDGSAVFFNRGLNLNFGQDFTPLGETVSGAEVLVRMARGDGIRKARIVRR